MALRFQNDISPCEPIANFLLNSVSYDSRLRYSKQIFLDDKKSKIFQAIDIIGDSQSLVGAIFDNSFIKRVRVIDSNPDYQEVNGFVELLDFISRQSEYEMGLTRKVRGVKKTPRIRKVPVTFDKLITADFTTQSKWDFEHNFAVVCYGALSRITEAGGTAGDFIRCLIAQRYRYVVIADASSSHHFHIDMIRKTFIDAGYHTLNLFTYNQQFPESEDRFSGFVVYLDPDD